MSIMTTIMKYFKNKVNAFCVIFLILFTLVMLFIRVAPCKYTWHRWEIAYDSDDVKMYKCKKCWQEKFIVTEIK